jgi:uncharacterized protein (DUF1015 family)
VQDPEPGVYVHEYTGDGLTIRGIVGALDIAHAASSTDDRAVMPHEGIHPDQVVDLADRMSTWELNPAPILLAHRGPEGVRDLVARTVASPPDREFVDRAHQHHRVWLVRSPSDNDRLNAALDGARALIADGHHRYAAYLRMHQSAPGGPRDRGLAMLVDQADTPLFLGAIHRVLLRSTLEQLRRACPPAARFAPAGSAAEALATLAQDTLVVTDGTSWASISLALSPDRTAVEMLHEDVLAPMALNDRRISYHHSVDEALARVANRRGVAVLMPAPDFDLVLRVAQAGRLLPEKATSFQPKPSLGVLMRSLRDE